jgi:hypothetical protein
MSLKATGTHHAKRCEGPASQGKRVHFREGRKNVLRSVQNIVLERPETRRAAVKPKQSPRSPQGGGPGPKQCPGRLKSKGLETREGQQASQPRNRKKPRNDPGVVIAPHKCALDY